MRIRTHQIRSSLPRGGSILPALALALLVGVGCLALVFDQVWLRAAQFEVQSAANAAALAAAAHLADDHLLREEADFPARAERARRLAGNLVGRNRAAGKVIRTAPRSEDIRIGRIIGDSLTGQSRFLETPYGSNHVVVTAHCSEATGNPLSLFFPYITGLATADVRALAAASISNDIVGVRPVASGSIPAWPLAVMESCHDERIETWSVQIEDRQGNDRFAWEPATGRVAEQPDGLREMTLRTSTEDVPGNVRLLDFGSGLGDEVLRRQFQDGLHREDLVSFGGALRFDQGPLPCAGAELSGAVEEWLASQRGRSRIIFLYREAADEQGQPNLLLTRVAAARILRVERTSECLQVIIQPSVIATRTALLRKGSGSAESEQLNPYLYKLALTY